MANTKSTTFVLICWNRREEVLYSLEQLKPLQHLADVVLVDNGSNDGTVEAVRQTHPWVNLQVLGENTGIHAYNHGAALAETPYLVFLDDDSHPSGNVVSEIEAVFASHPDVGIIAFEIVLPDTGEIVTLEHQPGPIAEFWGCGFAIRRELWQALAGYDADFFLYVNEQDLGIRCWDRGFSVMYHPVIKSYHRVSSSNRMSGRMLYHVVRNNIFMVYKDIPRRYWPRCLAPLLISMFIRSLVTRQVAFWIRGVRDGFANRGRFLDKHKAVSETVVRFYLKKYKQYEWPLAKLLRKSREGFNWLNLRYR